MKKTTYINIKGLNFILEEQAYESLKNYMERLERKLANIQDKEEIIEDIELRIAELFSQKLSGSKEVIDLLDVESTIAALGEPEQYIDEDGETETHEKRDSIHENRSADQQSEKKLYRDMENASIAGVCSGLAAYFNIELILVRIIFIVLLLGGGFAFPLYVILWIVLPKANTHIDRLRMRGAPITVETVRDEVEMAAQRLSKSSKHFQQQLRKDTVFTKGVNSLGRILSKIIGFFLLIFGLLFSIVFVFVFILGKGVVPVTDEAGMLTPYEFGLLILSPDQLNFVWWMGGAMLVIFIIYTVASAMRFILQTRYPWYKYLTRFIIVAVTISIIVAIFAGTTITREFTFDSEIKKEIATTDETFEIQYSSRQSKTQGNKNIRSRNHSELTIKNGYIFQEGYRIRLKESMDSSFHIYYVRSANGSSNNISLERAQNIRFSGSLQNKILHLPNYYSYPTKDKIRAQRLRLIIEIPAGKTVKFRDEYYTPEEDSYELWIPSTHWNNQDWGE